MKEKDGLKNKQNRLLVIGLDGATFDLILPWVKAGELPTFDRLLQTGAAVPLRSVTHPYTAQAWTTMMTGRNAGAHRIFDFWERDFATYGFKLLNAGMRTTPALWTILSQRDLPVIVVNVPMSYPPEQVKGVMVSGRDTPGLDSAYTYPPSLKHELGQALKRDYVIVPNDWRHAKRREFIKVRDALLDEIEVRVAATQHLMQTRDWRFCMFVISATDGAMHFLWQFHDETHPLHNPAAAPELRSSLLQIYRHVDDALARLLKTLPDDVTTVLVSDHGGGGNPSSIIHLNLWLAQQGLLAFRASSKNTAVPLARALEALKKRVYGLVSFQTLTKLRRLWPDRFRSRLSDATLLGDIDWAQTRAFSEERRGNIWINLKGRDPQGIVEEGAEYEAIRDQIVETLPNLQDPLTGEKPVKRVWRREELFAGPFLKKLPDLVVETESPDIFRSRGKYVGSDPVRQIEPSELQTQKTSGGHRYNGIFVAAGPNIRRGAWLDEMSMIDVSPTLLYMLGEAIPSEMEGRVIKELFEQEYLQTQPPKCGDSPSLPGDTREDKSYSDEESKEIEKRLAGLGYLD